MLTALDTPAELARKLERAYSTLEDLITQQIGVELDLYAAQTALIDARSEILCTNDAKTLGPNAEVREAEIALRLTKQRQQVTTCEQARTEARMQVEIARLRVEHLRAQLRLLEVTVGLPRAA